MAVNRWWEEGLNMEIWVFGGQCASCGGVLKYRYSRQDKPGMELQIMPNRKQFRLMERNTQTMAGPLIQMVEKLNAL